MADMEGTNGPFVVVCCVDQKAERPKRRSREGATQEWPAENDSSPMVQFHQIYHTLPPPVPRMIDPTYSSVMAGLVVLLELLRSEYGISHSISDRSLGCATGISADISASSRSLVGHPLLRRLYLRYPVTRSRTEEFL